MAKSQTRSVDLPRIVDLDALDAVRETLLDALSEGPVEVVAEGVERVSTNALFMLLSAAQTARQAKTDLVISKPSAPVRAAIGKLGLETAFAPVLKG